MKWTVYKIVNPEGRVYVGRTKNYLQRVVHYKSSTKKAPDRPIIDSINKFGIEKHFFEILEEFDGDERLANGKEIFWIRTYMSNKLKFPDNNGLNLNDGGIYGQSRSNVGKKRSEDQRKRISEAHKGIPSSHKRAINMYERSGRLVGEFESLSQASEYLNVLRTSISNNLRGRSSFCNNHVFKYKGGQL